MAKSSLKQPAFLILLVLLTVGAVAMRVSLSAMELHLRKLPIYAEGNRQVRSLPPAVGDWFRVHSDTILSPEVVEELGTSNYLDRTYVRLKPGKTKADLEDPTAVRDIIQLHLAYYTGMIDAVPHVPERCFVGGGMSVTGGPFVRQLPLDQSRILHDYYGDGYDYLRVPAIFDPQGHDTVRLPVIPDSSGNPAIRITSFEDAGTPGKTTYAGYMFLANGVFVTHAEAVRLYAFHLRDDYAYYMKIQFTSPPGFYDSPDDMAAACADLFNELLPGILLCVPDWVKVEKGLYPPDNPRRPSGSEK